MNKSDSLDDEEFPLLKAASAEYVVDKLAENSITESGSEETGEKQNNFRRFFKGMFIRPKITETEIHKEQREAKAKAKAKADAWEKAQKIKMMNRYHKTIYMITEWEIFKKEKARNRLQSKQNGSERIRAEATQKYVNEILKIEKVTGDAKSLAEERKRRDEEKLRTKQAEIRLTGKLSHACCSF